MMYLNTVLATNSLYFINSINEPDSLIDFIEKADSVEELFPIVSKWESAGNNIFKKDVSLETFTIPNEKVYQRSLYIKNSFFANIDFCKNLYSDSTGLDCGPITELNIYKKNPGSYEYNFKNDKVENLVNVYVILNSDPDSIPFCVDKGMEIYIRPEHASILMIPDELDSQIGENTSTDTYYAKASFIAMPKKNLGSA